jgi:hypothetical protein
MLSFLLSLLASKEKEKTGKPKNRKISGRNKSFIEILKVLMKFVERKSFLVVKHFLL